MFILFKGFFVQPTSILKFFGAALNNGNNLVLTKTFDVKGTTFSAKVGTVIHKIHLVAYNKEQIDGKVNGAQFVIHPK